MLYTQLRSFHAVAREGSVTAAARAINVSQPTITTQVRELEAHYGVELFHRRGRRLELTQLGRELLLRTQQFFGAEDEVVELLEAAGDLTVGLLRVGAVGPFHVMRMLSLFQKRYPGIRVSVELGNSREVLKALTDYRTDVAVLSQIEPDPNLLTIPYSWQRVLAFVRSDHPWSGRAGIALAELGGQDMIMREVGSMTRRAFEGALARANVRPNIVMEIGSREAVWESVAEGHGIGVVSEASVQPDARLWALPIVDAEIYTYTHVVSLKERSDARLVRAFLNVIESSSERSATERETKTEKEPLAIS